MDKQLIEWIQGQGKTSWKDLIRDWKQTAEFLDDKDPVLATICRRVAKCYEQMEERLQACLITHQIDEADEMEREVDDILKRAINKLDPK